MTENCPWVEQHGGMTIYDPCLQEDYSPMIDDSPELETPLDEQTEQ